MKLLLNENNSRTTALAIRQDGHDAVWIGDGFEFAEDGFVLAKARREARVLVTKDKDFGELAVKQGLAHHGILLLRLQDEGPENTLRVTRAVLEVLSRHRPPYFAVASEGGLRIRRPRR